MSAKTKNSDLKKDTKRKISKDNFKSDKSKKKHSKIQSLLNFDDSKDNLKNNKSNKKTKNISDSDLDSNESLPSQKKSKSKSELDSKGKKILDTIEKAFEDSDTNSEKAFEDSDKNSENSLDEISGIKMPPTNDYIEPLEIIKNPYNPLNDDFELPDEIKNKFYNEKKNVKMPYSIPRPSYQRHNQHETINKPSVNQINNAKECKRLIDLYIKNFFSYGEKDNSPCLIKNLENLFDNINLNKEKKVNKVFFFEIKLSDDTIILAHKEILKNYEYFIPLLKKTNFQESSENIILFKDFSPKTVKAVIKYLYTNSINQCDDLIKYNINKNKISNETIELLDFGKMLLLDDFVKKICNKLFFDNFCNISKKTISANSIIEVFKNNEKYLERYEHFKFLLYLHFAIIYKNFVEEKICYDTVIDEKSKKCCVHSIKKNDEFKKDACVHEYGCCERYNKIVRMHKNENLGAFKKTLYEIEIMAQKKKLDNFLEELQKKSKENYILITNFIQSVKPKSGSYYMSQMNNITNEQEESSEDIIRTYLKYHLKFKIDEWSDAVLNDETKAKSDIIKVQESDKYESTNNQKSKIYSQDNENKHTETKKVEANAKKSNEKNDYIDNDKNKKHSKEKKEKTKKFSENIDPVPGSVLNPKPRDARVSLFSDDSDSKETKPVKNNKKSQTIINDKPSKLDDVD